MLNLGVTASAVIAINQAVSHAGGVAAAGANALGFAQLDAASGTRVTVTAGGTAVAIAGAAITAGAAVEVGTQGRVITRASGVTVGRALTAATAAGDQVEVLVIPN
jgi:hypothetical protein